MFAAGCFWGIQHVFSKLPGVIKSESGYSGGNKENPTYREVCSDATGHAEAVHIVFDPKKISYKKLLNAFWQIHDPTTLNRQGPDFGSQYRSAIFYFNDKQKKEAIDSMKEEQRKLTKKIVTEIVPAGKFYLAEDYHQDYVDKHPGSCHVPILKKDL